MRALPSAAARCLISFASRVHARGVVVEHASARRRRSPGRRRSTAGRDRRPSARPSRRRASSITLSAMSSCTNSTRAAEQRWPAESKAEPIASLTSCSGSAEESAISAFWPPVSAISAAIGGVARGQRAVDRARGFGGAGEGHAGDARVAGQRGADAWRRRRAGTAARSPARRLRAAASPRHGRSGWSARRAWRSRVLPAASAAATWPMKIASGKFHGLMQTNTPRPCSCSSLDSPVGPGSFSGCAEQLARLRGVVAQEVDRLAHFGDRRRAMVLPASFTHSAMNSGMRCFQQVGGVLEDLRARRRPACGPSPVARRPRSPAPARPSRRRPAAIRRPICAAVGGIGHRQRARCDSAAPGTSGAARPAAVDGGVDLRRRARAVRRRWRG